MSSVCRSGRSAPSPRANTAAVVIYAGLGYLLYRVASRSGAAEQSGLTCDQRPDHPRRPGARGADLLAGRLVHRQLGGGARGSAAGPPGAVRGSSPGESATLFGGAMFTAARLGPIRPGGSQDDWWHQNPGKAIVVWSLVEAPSLLGLVAYSLTRDFRTLIATFIHALGKLPAESFDRALNAGGNFATGGHRDRRRTSEQPAAWWASPTSATIRPTFWAFPGSRPLRSTRARPDRPSTPRCGACTRRASRSSAWTPRSSAVCRRS